MALPVPDIEPASFRVGDFLTWTKDLPDFPADASWVLTYTLINAAAKITITASASGTLHLVSVLPATTAGYAAGLYTWAARVTKATESYTVGEGSMLLEPNLAALTTYDGRSFARTMMEAIEAAMEGRASSLQMKMEINGRSLEYMSATDMIKWYSYYKSIVAQEAAKESITRTGIDPRRIGVRFKRV